MEGMLVLPPLCSEKAKRQSCPSGVQKVNYFRGTVEHQQCNEILRFGFNAFLLNC